MPSPPPRLSDRPPGISLAEFNSWTPEARACHVAAVDVTEKRWKEAKKRQKKDAEAVAAAEKQRKKDAAKAAAKAKKQQRTDAEEEKQKKRKLDPDPAVRCTELLPLPLDPSHATPAQAALSTFKDIKKTTEAAVRFVVFNSCQASR